MLLPGKSYLSEVFDLYIGASISFADAYRVMPDGDTNPYVV